MLQLPGYKKLNSITIEADCKKKKQSADGKCKNVRSNEVTRPISPEKIILQRKRALRYIHLCQVYTLCGVYGCWDKLRC